MEIDFWFDVVCPFAYLASARIEGARGRSRGDGPVAAGPARGPAEGRSGARPTRTRAMSDAKQHGRGRDMARRRRGSGVPLRFPRPPPADGRRDAAAGRDPEAEVPASPPAVPGVLGRRARPGGPGRVNRIGRPRGGTGSSRRSGDQGSADAPPRGGGARGVRRSDVRGFGRRAAVGRRPAGFVREALGLPEDRSAPASSRSRGQVTSCSTTSRARSATWRPPRSVGSGRRAPIRGRSWSGRCSGTSRPQVPLHTFLGGETGLIRQDMAAWADATGSRCGSRPVPDPVGAGRGRWWPNPARRWRLYRAAWAEDRDRWPIPWASGWCSTRRVRRGGPGRGDRAHGQGDAAAEHRRASRSGRSAFRRSGWTTSCFGARTGWTRSPRRSPHRAPRSASRSHVGPPRLDLHQPLLLDHPARQPPAVHAPAVEAHQQRLAVRALHQDVPAPRRGRTAPDGSRCRPPTTGGTPGVRRASGADTTPAPGWSRLARPTGGARRGPPRTGPRPRTPAGP